MSHMDKVQKTQAQLDELEKETKQSPLTSQPLPLSTLRGQYSTGSSNDGMPSSFFVQGVDDLSKRYSTYRSTRGDGNCYYRAVLYSLACQFLGGLNPKEYQRLLMYFEKDSFEKATSVGGYSEISLEIFHDTLVDFWKQLPQINPDELHKELNEENSTSEYCCWYLRSIAATYLKADPDRFLPFLLAEDSTEIQYMDVGAFCSSQIDPMGSEATQITVLAVAEALNVRVEVEYLDGHPFQGQLTKHTFGPSSMDKSDVVTLTLLYRPGHYDILNN